MNSANDSDEAFPDIEIIIEFDLEEEFVEPEDQNVIVTNVVDNPHETPDQGTDAPHILPSSSSCYFDRGLLGNYRFQRYDSPGTFTGCLRRLDPDSNGQRVHYIDSGQLRSALRRSSHCTFRTLAHGGCVAIPFVPEIRAWTVEARTIEFDMKTPKDFKCIFRGVIQTCGTWEEVARDCEPFKKPAHDNYIVSRFLNPSSCEILIAGLVHEDFALSDQALVKCVSDACTGLKHKIYFEWLNRKDGTSGLPGHISWVELGTHPLGFFSLFVPEAVHDRLYFTDYDNSILHDETTVRKAIKAIRATQRQLNNRRDPATNVLPSDHTQELDWSTVTTLNLNKLSKIVGTKRPFSQKTVMYGHSASEVAKIFNWDEPVKHLVNGRNQGIPQPRPKPRGMKHRAEWLHRSAFSFGGLGVKRLSAENSQQVKNLIFGSVEANTSMIRAENTMKRLAIKTSEVLNLAPESEVILGRVRTSAELVQSNSQTGDRCIWLASKLKYGMEFDASLLSQNLGVIQRTVKFDPFSRKVPLRFEVQLDEMVENAWVRSFK
ncbi:unnamed protein product [Rhizoctonia solani]|uniref:Uncharacterized protein n=1 Tax=Rhizoctonia solani TaxID=456999 RepID=A0A8H3B2T1_9AGAM|nr:unnamed protein product [Rhizoctonia solani]